MITMSVTVNGLRSRSVSGAGVSHVNSLVARIRIRVAELTAVYLLPPKLEAAVQKEKKRYSFTKNDDKLALKVER